MDMSGGDSALNRFRQHEIVGIIGVTAVIMLLAWFYCIQMYPPEDDVINFYNNAESIKAGLLPYVDFTFEFPPFALVFFLIPSMFTSDLNTYAALFALQIALFVIFTQYFLVKICKRVGIDQYIVSGLFLLFVLMYFSEAIKKFDMIVMFTTVVALWAYLSGYKKTAYTMLAVGAFIKMYPALFIPILMIFDILEERAEGLKTVGVGIVCCFAVAATALLPLVLVGVPVSDSMSFVTFHTDRGFQVESVVAVIVQFAALLGFTEFELIGVHYTYDVVNPLCDMLQPIWMQVCVAIFVVVLASIVYSLYSKGTGIDYTERSKLIIVCLGIMTLVFLLTNKVFSTQYMIWLFPIAALLCVTGQRRVSFPILLVFLLAQLFTALITKYPSGSDYFIISNVLRDSMLVVALVFTVRFVVSRRGPLASSGISI